MIANGLIKAFAPELFAQLWDKFMMLKSNDGTLGRSVCATMQQQPMGH
jgi:hypothetical protein